MLIHCILFLRVLLTVVLIEFEYESKRDNWNNPRENDTFTTIKRP